MDMLIDSSSLVQIVEMRPFKFQLINVLLMPVFVVIAISFIDGKISISF